MKAMKITVLAIFALSICSCDLFLTPLKGRFNVGDPNTELVPAGVTLTPALDGYINSVTTDWNSVTFLVGASSYGLLKFDLSSIPDIILKAELRMRASAASNDVRVCQIVQNWDTSSITFAKVSGAGFYDPNNTPVVGSIMGGMSATWDVTRFVKAGAANGFCVITPAGSGTSTPWSLLRMRHSS